VTLGHALNHQGGSANLLVALVLMMAMTLLTLSVAHTQLTETRMAGNERWHARLASIAESEWQEATSVLTDPLQQLVWAPSPEGNMLMSQLVSAATAEGLTTTLAYRRTHSDSPLVAIQVITGLASSMGISGRISQTVRLLTVLSPLAETAPPLVINGCLTIVPANLTIRPSGSDTAAAGDALWHYGGASCPAFAAIDLHGGEIARKPLENSLWSSFFSISQDEYARLARLDLALPAAQRRYWWIEPSTLTSGKWSRSLGSEDQPVVLYFPPATGCPRFAAGVRIFGVVFIDTACPQPLASRTLEIVGSLVINGSATTGHATIQLNHIQTADRRQTRLSLPAVKIVKVPGSWKDF
jgi:hypothetical protein